MREVGLLSLLPVCLALAFGRIGKAVRARRHDARHAIAETVADILQPGLAALILDAVVKKRRDDQISAMIAGAQNLCFASSNTALFMLMPMTSPALETSGPPELPGLSVASVWITSSISRPFCERSDRPSAPTGYRNL